VPVDVVFGAPLRLGTLTRDTGGRMTGRHVGTGIVRPSFWERARYFGMERELAEALDELQQ